MESYGICSSYPFVSFASFLTNLSFQTRSVPFTITAHITGTDISFSVPELDFGCCSIYESVRVEFSMQNHCLLPQMYGFVSLPDVSYSTIEYYSNDQTYLLILIS